MSDNTVEFKLPVTTHRVMGQFDNDEPFIIGWTDDNSDFDIRIVANEGENVIGFSKGDKSFRIKVIPLHLLEDEAGS